MGILQFVFEKHKVPFSIYHVAFIVFVFVKVETVPYILFAPLAQVMSLVFIMQSHAMTYSSGYLNLMKTFSTFIFAFSTEDSTAMQLKVTQRAA